MKHSLDLGGGSPPHNSKMVGTTEIVSALPPLSLNMGTFWLCNTSASWVILYTQKWIMYIIKTSCVNPLLMALNLSRRHHCSIKKFRYETTSYSFISPKRGYPSFGAKRDFLSYFHLLIPSGVTSCFQLSGSKRSRCCSRKERENVSWSSHKHFFFVGWAISSLIK